MIRLKRKALFLGWVILIFSGCSPQAREARALAQGKMEFQKKNFQVAIIHFKNAIAAQPKDAEAYYQLGLAYLASNDINTAGSFFQKATELNPKHAGAQLKLAELLAPNRAKEAVQEAQRRTKVVLTLLPEDTDALNVLAFTELRLGQPDSAEEHLKQALRKSPDNLRSSVALAGTRLSRGDVAGAEEALKQAIGQAPKSPEPRAYLGGFYLALGRPAEAEQEYRHALDVDAKYGPALLAVARIQVRAGRSDQAEQTFRLISALPEKAYKPMHALFLLQSGKGIQGVAELEALAKADPENRDLRTDLVRAYLALGRVGDAEKVLTAALKKNGLDTDAMLQRSRLYLISAKYTEAQNDLNQVLHFRNDSAEAHYLLSKAYQGKGDIALQHQELGQSLKLDPKLLPVRIELTRTLIAGGGAQSALKLLDEVPQEQKGALDVLVQRNWALLLLGQIPEARKGIEALSAAKAPDAPVQDAALKLAQKDYTGAATSAERALDQNPENVRALSVLVLSYSAQNQMATGVRKARERAGARPESALMQQFLGQVLLSNGDRPGARKAFEAARTDKPGLLPSELALAAIDTEEGRWDDARQTLSALVSSHPANVNVRLLFANLEMTAGKTAEAIGEYRKAVALDENNAQALNGLAYILAETRQSDEAMKYAQKAKELAPDNPAVDDTLGWAYFQKGLYTLAVSQLEGATAKGGSAVPRYHLAMAYLKAGNPQRGRLTLEAALKMDPNLPEAQAARQIFGIRPN